MALVTLGFLRSIFSVELCHTPSSFKSFDSRVEWNRNRRETKASLRNVVGHTVSK